MRLIVFLSLFTFRLAYAQVVFCPPGAEWHYSFYYQYGPGSPITFYNENIKYVGDSVAGTDTIRILTHKRFYLACNEPFKEKRTFLRQSGDTIAFWNSQTNSTWQILYNFATGPGFGWQTTIKDPLNSSNVITYGFTVDSVAYVNINGFNLKCLYINGDRVVERLGFGTFLFKFNKFCSHAERFNDNLCYSDSSLGLFKYSSYPCDYSGYFSEVGVEENRDSTPILIFPNPAIDVLTLQGVDLHSVNVSVYSVYGQNLTSKIKIREAAEIEVGDLPPGIYQLKLCGNFASFTARFVKL